MLFIVIEKNTRNFLAMKNKENEKEDGDENNSNAPPIYTQ